MILGCGNFGGIGSSPAFFGQGMSRDAAFRLMDAAWDAGITTFDTADAYGGGRSETFIGQWLATKPHTVRDHIVIATKTFNPMNDAADHGLSAQRIHRQIDTSLTRLGVERVALYLAHEFDADVSLDETHGAFDDLIILGKVGAVGASNFSAAQLSAALDVADRAGGRRYQWVQNSYSLMERGDEAQLLPLCRSAGLGYTPFSPLAGGWLTGKYRRGVAPPEGSRMTLRPEPYEGYRTNSVFDKLETLARFATASGSTMATLSLAWALAQPGLTAIVIGPNHVGHLQPATDAVTASFSSSRLNELTELFS